MREAEAASQQAAGVATVEPPRRAGGPGRWAVVVATAVSALVTVVLLWPQHGLAFAWDEVDYLNAARQGVVTNLLDRGALSIPAYLRFARSKVDHTTPHLPASYNELTDPYRLRHGHSPAVVVGMWPFSHGHGERGPRVVQLIGALALTIALVVAYRLVSPTWTWAGFGLIVVVAPWYGWHMFQAIQFHGWATVWLCLGAAFLVRWLVSGRDKRWGLALCAALVLSIVTLESTVFMIVGILASIVIWVRGLARRPRVAWLRRYVVPAALLVVAATTVLGPGMLLKGAFIKVPAERFYQVFLGESQVYYLTGSSDLLSYLLPVLLAVPTVAYLAARRREEAMRWGPLVVMAVVYVALVIRFAVSDTYWLPAMAPVLLLAAWVIGLLAPRAQAFAFGAALAVMAVGFGSILHANTTAQRKDQQTRADFAFVGSYVGTSRALMDGGHIFQHYLPTTDIHEISFNPNELLDRREGEYVALPRSAYAGTVVGILSGRTSFLTGLGARTLSAECPRTVRPTVVLWDCRGLSP